MMQTKEMEIIYNILSWSYRKNEKVLLFYEKTNPRALTNQPHVHKWPYMVTVIAAFIKH